MKKKLLNAMLGTAVGTLGLAACDAAQPPKTTVSPAIESEAIAPGETLEDTVREKLAEVLRDGDAYSRVRRLSTLLPTLGPELVPAVEQTLDDRALDYRFNEFDLLLRYWATHQPEAATLWARKLSQPDYRAGAVYTTLRLWAKSDPQAATSTAWSWGADDVVLVRAAPIALVRGWYAQGDSPELTLWMRSLPRGILRQRAVAAYIRVVIETQGSDAAIRWAESLSDEYEGFKLAAFRRLVDTLTTLDPQAGVRMCEAHCDGPYGSNMRSLIARKWVVQDGPAAMAWLSTHEPDIHRDQAVRHTHAKWARTDRDAATAWMTAETTEGAEPWLVPAIPNYARLLAEEAPLDALEWTRRIQDDAEREEVLIDVLRVWRYLHEAEAEEWMEQASLPEEARGRVRDPLPQSPRRQRLEERAEAAGSPTADAGAAAADEEPAPAP